MARVLKGRVYYVTYIFVSDDIAVVEMTSTPTTVEGETMAIDLLLITRFIDGLIVEVRAYLDSVLVQQVIDENER